MNGLDMVNNGVLGTQTMHGISLPSCQYNKHRESQIGVQGAILCFEMKELKVMRFGMS